MMRFPSKNIDPISNMISLCKTPSKLFHRATQSKISQKIIILLGDTKAGKTTLLYYLSGLRLIKKMDEQKNIILMQPQNQYEHASISNSSISTTELPNIFTQNQENYTIIDMPGFNDDRFVNKVSNVFMNQMFFNQIQSVKNVHICIVIEENTIDLPQLLKNLQQFSIFLNIQILKQKKNCSVILTKINQEEVQDIKQKFFQCLDQLRQEVQVQQSEENLLKLIQFLLTLKQSQEDFIYYFPNTDPQIQKGKQITNQILARNKFYSQSIKKQQSILYENYSKSIMSIYLQQFDFHRSLSQLIQEASQLIKVLLNFLIQINRLFHKNFIETIYENEDRFNQQLLLVCNKNFTVFKQLLDVQKSKDYQLQNFADEMKTLCGSVKKQGLLYYLDKRIIQFQKFITGQMNRKQQQTSRQQIEAQSDTYLIKINEFYTLTLKFININFAQQQQQQKQQNSNMFSEFLLNSTKSIQFMSNRFFSLFHKIVNEKLQLKLKQVKKGFMIQCDKLFTSKQRLILKQKTKQILQNYVYQQESSDDESQQQSQDGFMSKQEEKR